MRCSWPGLMTVVMLAVLLGLGTWQVHRLHWKEAILAQIARAEAAPPVPLPSRTRALHQGRRHRPPARRPVRAIRRRGARHARGPAARHLPDPAAGTPGRAAAVGGSRLGAAEAARRRSPSRKARPPSSATSTQRKRPACSAPQTIPRRASSTRWIPRRSARRWACRRSRRSSWSRSGPHRRNAGRTRRSICRSRRTTTCPTPSPGMASRWRSW